MSIALITSSNIRRLKRFLKIARVKQDGNRRTKHGYDNV